HPREGFDPGGRSGFESRLRGLRLQPGFDSVRGVVVVSDNDQNPNASFQEARSLIHNASFSSPNNPYAFAPGSPPVAVILIPAQNVNGQLETLCLTAISSAWPTQFHCAQTFATCIGIGAWANPNKRERATLRALISHICQRDPNSSLTHLWHDGREEVIPLS